MKFLRLADEPAYRRPDHRGRFFFHRLVNKTSFYIRTSHAQITIIHISENAQYFSLLWQELHCRCAPNFTIPFGFPKQYAWVRIPRPMELIFIRLEIFSSSPFGLFPRLVCAFLNRTQSRYNQRQINYGKQSYHYSKSKRYRSLNLRMGMIFFVKYHFDSF